MSQDTLNEIIDLENKFQKLVEVGHPNVVDNGFFIDAVFNVTSQLKKQHRINLDAGGIQQKDQIEEDLLVIGDLYKSLKAFEGLYTNRLVKEKI